MRRRGLRRLTATTFSKLARIFSEFAMSFSKHATIFSKHATIFSEFATAKRKILIYVAYYDILEMHTYEMMQYLP